MDNYTGLINGLKGQLRYYEMQNQKLFNQIIELDEINQKLKEDLAAKDKEITALEKHVTQLDKFYLEACKTIEMLNKEKD